MPVRLEPAAPRSRVKHSTTEPLRSLREQSDLVHIFCNIGYLRIYADMRADDKTCLAGNGLIYMGLNARKPVFRVCSIQPAQLQRQASNIEILHASNLYTIHVLSREQITKALTRQSCNLVCTFVVRA